MANNQAFKIKNGLSAKRYLQNSTAVSASDVDLSTGSYFTKTLSANTTFTFSNPPASGKAMGFALEVTGANVTNGYDWDALSYASISLNVASQEPNPRGIAFKSDGTKLFFVGSGYNYVYQYALTTPWDVSTKTGAASGVQLLDTNISLLAFNDDGTKMYAGGYGNDRLNEYDLNTAWDVSSVATQSGLNNVDLSGEDVTPLGLFFKPDGTSFYITGNTSGYVYQYDLSTAWDLSTASHNTSKKYQLSLQDSVEIGVVFNSDGTEMFFLGSQSDRLYRYSLSTAWDVSTASYQSQVFSISSQGTTPTGLATSSDGEYLYFADSGNDTIYQYTFSSTATATVAWPSSVKWSGATAPDAPASGEKDVYVFVTTDGGTTYYGKQAGDAVA